MKKCAVLMLTIALMMSLFAALPAAGAQEPVTITYWHHDASDNIVAAMTELNKIFEAENPDIKVDFLALPADSFHDKYVIAIATETAPDAFGVRIQELASLVTLDALEPLDEYMASWDEYPNIEKAALDAVRATAPDGKLYMLPGYTNVLVNWYNTALFAEKGITYPETIDEFLTLCEQNADAAQGKYFYTFRGGKGAWSNVFPFVLSYSGVKSFFDEDGKALFNTPEAVEGLEKYIDIYKNGWCSRDGINNSYKEMVLEFGSGTAMLMAHNTSSLPEHTKNLGEGNFMLGVASFAGKDGLRAIPALEPIGASVSATSQNKEAATKLVEFYASAQAMSYYCEAVGKVPLNTGIYGDEWYAKSPYMTAVQGILSDPSIAWFLLPNYLNEWTEFCNVVDADVQAMCLGEMDAATALERWSTDLEAYYAAYQAAG